MRQFQIRNMVRVEIDGEGEWPEAEVVMGPERMHVSRRFGSWMHETPDGYREVLPELSFALQRAARKRWPAIERELTEKPYRARPRQQEQQLEEVA